MDEEKSRQLMSWTYDESYERPYMRIADDLLDLDEEAQPVADAMYEILHDRKWKWPDLGKHLSAWKDDRGDCQKDPSEDDEEYRDRMERWRAWPKLKTARQAEWLRCAMVTSRVLGYLQQCRRAVAGELSYTSSKQSLFYFRPEKFL